MVPIASWIGNAVFLALTAALLASFVVSFRRARRLATDPPLTDGERKRWNVAEGPLAYTSVVLLGIPVLLVGLCVPDGAPIRAANIVVLAAIVLFHSAVTTRKLVAQPEWDQQVLFISYGYLLVPAVLLQVGYFTFTGSSWLLPWLSLPLFASASWILWPTLKSRLPRRASILLAIALAGLGWSSRSALGAYQDHKALTREASAKTWLEMEPEWAQLLEYDASTIASALSGSEPLRFQEIRALRAAASHRSDDEAFVGAAARRIEQSLRASDGSRSLLQADLLRELAVQLGRGDLIRVHADRVREGIAERWQNRSSIRGGTGFSNGYRVGPLEAFHAIRLMAVVGVPANVRLDVLYGLLEDAGAPWPNSGIPRQQPHRLQAQFALNALKEAFPEVRRPFYELAGDALLFVAILMAGVLLGELGRQTRASAQRFDSAVPIDEKGAASLPQGVPIATSPST